MKIVWVCPKCNWVSVSDSSYRHCLDECKCRQCFMDLEEDYCRIQGNPKTLAIYDKGKWKRKNEKKNKV